MSCPNCGREIAAGQKFCNYCGARQQEGEAPRPGRSAGIWIAVGLLLVVLVAVLSYRIYTLSRPAQQAAVSQQQPQRPSVELTLPQPAAPARAPEAAAPEVKTAPPRAATSAPPRREPARRAPMPIFPITAPASEPPAAPAATPAPEPAAPPSPAAETAPPKAVHPVRPRVEIFRPDTSEPPPPPKTIAAPPSEPAAATPARSAEPPVYQGPSAGTLIWSGQVEKNTLVRIEGDRVSPGRLTGELPGVAVTIEPPAEFAVVEAPGPANHWKRLYLRSLKRIDRAVVIKWSVRPSR